jgi:hypothetical protein
LSRAEKVVDALTASNSKARPCAKPPAEWMTKRPRFDTQKKPPYGDASPEAERDRNEWTDVPECAQEPLRRQKPRERGPHAQIAAPLSRHRRRCARQRSRGPAADALQHRVWGVGGRALPLRSGGSHAARASSRARSTAGAIGASR